MKDEGRATLAQIMAKDAPQKAAEELAAIADPLRRAVAASSLSAFPAFAGTLEGALELMLALEDDPKALADLITGLIAAHPDSALVAQWADQLRPPARNLADCTREILADRAILDFVKPTKFEGYSSSLLNSPEAIARALSRGILASLQEEGLIDPEDYRTISKRMGAARILKAEE